MPTDPVGQRLHTVRKNKHMTLRQLAEAAHVPLSTLSAIETGKRAGDGLTLATARRLAIALGITLDHLAFRYEEEERRPVPAQEVG